MTTNGTIIFVHGTGVRLEGYAKSIEIGEKMAAAAGIAAKVTGCVWGDPLGVDYGGLSLPDPPSEAEQLKTDEDNAYWALLFGDPLFELERLTIPDAGAEPPIALPGRKPAWEVLWERIEAYAPNQDFTALLRRGGLEGYWTGAWAQLTKGTEIPRTAFEQSSRELPEASSALARSAVAHLHIAAVAGGATGPSHALREAMVARLIVDWDQKAYAVGGLFAKILKRLGTGAARARRNQLSTLSALQIGDVLLYQARSAEVRDFIQSKIAAAEPPVTLFAHSLGGIACFELLAMPGAPKVERFVTIGSQSPFLYEIGALGSLKPPQPLPADFPKWLNIYDRNDFLSYVAGRLFPQARDFEAKSGQPFPDSHSAYVGNREVWAEIAAFLQP